MLEVISLGAGVQSSTMALMAARRAFDVMPTAAIFADTQAESRLTYAYLDWLEQQLPFPVYRVTVGNLAKDTLDIRISKKSGNVYQRTLIPLFIKSPTGGTRGVLPRKCTRDYKINAIITKERELLGMKRVAGDDAENTLIRQWIGISTDEAHRMKPAAFKWIENCWPLIDEAGMSREDCKAWLRVHGYPEPPRSACVFCPYHSDLEWLRLKTEDPEGFDAAVRWERLNQVVSQMDEVIKGVPFLHDSCIPIDQVVFDVADKKPSQFGNECEGMCGV